MYPNLRYAIYDLTGFDVPAFALIQTYGFFLAFTFLACGWALTADLKRRERLGILQGMEEMKLVGQPLSALDVITNAILGFLLGFKGLYAISNTDLFTGPEARTYLLSMEHGSWIGGIGLAALFTFLKYRDNKKERLEHPEPKEVSKLVMPHERVSDIIILAAISGIIGAKLLYMTEVEYQSMEQMVGDFFSGSGLSVYGGFILAFFVVTYYVRSKNMPLLQMIDACAPAMILGTGLGRLGCHFSGDGDWGDPNPYAKPASWIPDWLWAYDYPNNVMSDGEAMADCYYPENFGDYCNVLPQGVFPTPIFELIICLIIFVILWSLRPKVTIHGIIFSAYLMFTGVQRFLLEMIRVNDDHAIAGLNLSQAQYISIFLMIIGLVLTLFLFSRQRKLAEK
ncbi:MAG: prolipoprotein diacylglyceryl transferase [Aureispira sp.]